MYTTAEELLATVTANAVAVSVSALARGITSSQQAEEFRERLEQAKAARITLVSGRIGSPDSAVDACFRTSPGGGSVLMSAFPISSGFASWTDLAPSHAVVTPVAAVVA